MDFVLDASVTMRWILGSPKASDQQYATAVLTSMEKREAVVPELWYLEVCNVLLGSERNRKINAGVSESFIDQLESFPLLVDREAAHQSFSRIINIARTSKLSSYDATYLELAIRTGLPLATLDKDLKKAAKKMDVEIYLA